MQTEDETWEPIMILYKFLIFSIEDNTYFKRGAGGMLWSYPNLHTLGYLGVSQLCIWPSSLIKAHYIVVDSYLM